MFILPQLYFTAALTIVGIFIYNINVYKTRLRAKEIIYYKNKLCKNAVFVNAVTKT